MELNFRGAGKLKHRVIVQSITKAAPYPGGQPVETPVTFAERWCSMEPLTGRELEIARQLNEEVTHKFVFRWFTGLSSRMQIVKGDRTFQIVSVLDPNEERLWWHVVATEKNRQ